MDHLYIMCRGHLYRMHHLIGVLLAIAAITHQHAIQIKCREVSKSITIKTFEGYNIVEMENNDKGCSFTFKYGSRPYVALKELTRDPGFENGTLGIQKSSENRINLREKKSWLCETTCGSLVIHLPTFVRKFVFAVAADPHFRDLPDVPFAEYNPGPGKFYKCDMPTVSQSVSGCRLQASHDFIIYKFENEESCRKPSDRNVLGFPVRSIKDEARWEWIAYKSCLQAQVIGEDIQEIIADEYFQQTIGVKEHGQFTRISHKERLRAGVVWFHFRDDNAGPNSGISTRGSKTADGQFRPVPSLVDRVTKDNMGRSLPKYDMYMTLLNHNYIKWPLNRFSAVLETWMTLQRFHNHRPEVYKECYTNCDWAYHHSVHINQVTRVPPRRSFDNDWTNGEVFSIHVETNPSCARHPIPQMLIAYNKLSRDTVCARLEALKDGNRIELNEEVHCLADEDLHIASYVHTCFKFKITPAEYKMIEVNVRHILVMKADPPGPQRLYRLNRVSEPWLYGSMEVDWKGCQKEDRAIWIVERQRFELRRNSSNFHEKQPAKIYAEFYNGDEIKMYDNHYYKMMRLALPLNCHDAVVKLYPYMKSQKIESVPWHIVNELWSTDVVNPAAVVLPPHDQYSINKGTGARNAFEDCKSDDKLALYGLYKNDSTDHSNLLETFIYGQLKTEVLFPIQLDKWPFIMFEVLKPYCFAISAKAITAVTGEIRVTLDDWSDRGFNIRDSLAVKFRVNVLNVIAPRGFSVAKVKIAFDDCPDHRKRAQVQDTDVKHFGTTVNVDPNKPLHIKFVGDDCVNAFVIAPKRTLLPMSLIPVLKDGIHPLPTRNVGEIIEVSADPEYSLFKRFEVIRDKFNGECQDQKNDPVEAWYGEENDRLDSGETINNTDISNVARYSLLSKVIFKLPKNQCYSVKMISIYELQEQAHFSFTNPIIRAQKGSANIRVVMKDKEGKYWNKVKISWSESAKCAVKKNVARINLDLVDGNNLNPLGQLKGIADIKGTKELTITAGHELQVVSNAFDCYNVQMISSWINVTLTESPFQKIDLIEIQTAKYKDNVIFAVVSDMPSYFWTTINMKGHTQNCSTEVDYVYFGIFDYEEEDGYERMREFKCGSSDINEWLGIGRRKVRVAVVYKPDPSFDIYFLPRETTEMLDEDSTPYVVQDIPANADGDEQTIIIPWSHGGSWQKFTFKNIKDCEGEIPRVESAEWTHDNKEMTKFEELKDLKNNWKEEVLSGDTLKPNPLYAYKVFIPKGCLALMKQIAAEKPIQQLNPLENSKFFTADSSNGNVLLFQVQGKSKFAAVEVTFTNCPNTEKLNYQVHIINEHKTTRVALKNGQKSQTEVSTGKQHSYHHNFKVGVPDACAKVRMISFTDPSFSVQREWDPNVFGRHTEGPMHVVYNVVKKQDGISTYFASLTVTALPANGQAIDEEATIFITANGTTHNFTYAQVKAAPKSLLGEGNNISILSPNEFFKVIAIPKKEPITKQLGLYVDSNDFIADRPQLLTIRSQPSAEVFDGLWDSFTVASDKYYHYPEECIGKTLTFHNVKVYEPIGTFADMKKKVYTYGEDTITLKYLSTQDFLIDVDNRCFVVASFGGGALEKVYITPDAVHGVSNKQDTPKYIYLKSTTGAALGRAKLIKVTKRAAESIVALDYDTTCSRSKVAIGGKIYQTSDLLDSGINVTINSTDVLVRMDSPCAQLIFGHLDKNAEKCFIPLKATYKNEFTKSSTCNDRDVQRKFIKPNETNERDRRYEPTLEISKNENATGCTKSPGMYIYLQGNRDDVKEEPIRYSDVERGAYANFYPSHVDPTNFVFILQDDCFKITFIDEGQFEGYSNDIPKKEENGTLLLATIVLWCLFVVACITFTIIFFKTMPPLINTGQNAAKMVDSIIM